MVTVVVVTASVVVAFVVVTADVAFVVLLTLAMYNM